MESANFMAAAQYIKPYRYGPRALVRVQISKWGKIVISLTLSVVVGARWVVLSTPGKADLL